MKRRSINKFSLLCLLLVQDSLYGQISLSVTPEVSQSSFAIPSRIEIKHSSGISLVHQNRLFHVDHPSKNYLWYSRERGSVTDISEVSYFSFRTDDLSISLGRNYLTSGPGKYAGIFASPVAPAVDNLSLHLDLPSIFEYDYTIVRLDNRKTLLNGQEATIQRWYYLRRLGINISNRIQIALKDAVIATGQDRGLEWNFLNPFALFGLEQIHESGRTEGLEPGLAGTGNNENEFIGFEWQFSGDNWRVYNEWLIDEFQVDSGDRDTFQDVFGTMFGLEVTMRKVNLVLEYAYASPWLYLNRGLFSAPERHELPLGLRSPHSQSIDLSLTYDFERERRITGQVHFEQRGSQTITTPWDNYNNKIGNFDFDDSLPLEIKIEYLDPGRKLFQKLGFYRSWLGSDQTQIVVGWNFDFSWGQ